MCKHLTSGFGLKCTEPVKLSNRHAAHCWGGGGGGEGGGEGGGMGTLLSACVVQLL